MSGAGFLLAVNFLIAQCFCMFFLAVSCARDFVSPIMPALAAA